VRKENFGKYTSTNSIELGVPFHVAIVMDSRTKTFSLYFNGQLDFCKDLLPGDSFSNSTGPLYFGSCPENPGEKEAWELENVTATITAHSCSIYLKALTSSEISALIAAAVQPSSSAGHSRETHSPTPRDCAASAVANENLSSVCSLVSSLSLSENDSSTCVQPSSSAGHDWETHFPDPRQKTDSSGSWQKAAPTSKLSIASPSNGYNGYNSFNSAAAAAEVAVVSSSCTRVGSSSDCSWRKSSSLQSGNSAASAMTNEKLSSVCSLVSSLSLSKNDSSTCVQPSSSAGHGRETHFPTPRDSAASAIANKKMSSVCSLVSSLSQSENDSTTKRIGS